ncbi:MAG: hypothetical protein JOZ25_00600 [Actinobacteria bacterium]|nr:hypothetical protein [Actinomycetota bacterium]
MRALACAISILVAQAVVASPAFAAGGNGEGLVGETNDKVITFFAFGLIVFFPLVVTIGTLLQTVLERRKAARKAARLRGRTGW